MRNKYPGICYRCGGNVGIGDGHFERYGNGWRLQHAKCAILCRETNFHYTANPLARIETKK
jgi:hypothetical protein